MICSRLRAHILRLEFLALLGVSFAGLIAQTAKADIVWTVDSTRTSFGLGASTVLPEWDPSVSLDPTVNHAINPLHPPVLDPTTGKYTPEPYDPDSETYAPPIVIQSFPQKDAGTSGNPSLAHPVNSTITSGVGTFRTVGNNFLTSVNFGANPNNISKATIVANDSGSWLPNLQDPSGGLSGSNDPVQQYGAATSANLAVTMTRTSPKDGYDNFSLEYGNDPHGFAKAPTDVGRLAAYGLKAVPFATKALAVSNGTFDSTSVQMFGQYGLAYNLREKSLDADWYTQAPIAYPASPIAPANLTGVLPNALTGSAALGVLSRSGSDYIMTLPFSAIDDLYAFVLKLDLHLVAKANILPGDVNFDGVVNEADRTLIMAHLGETNAKGLGIGDANGDGIVNTNDIGFVPEPASLVLFALGAVALAALRARRVLKNR